MKTILIFLASLITVYCVGCANGCSGHGTCSKERECTCFRQQGLGLNNGDFEDFGWTGADCSQRMCPEGLSFASQSYQNVIPWFNAGTKVYKAKYLKGYEVNPTSLTAASYKQIVIEDNLSELILAGAGGRAICYDDNMAFVANIDIFMAELHVSDTYIYGVPTSFSKTITGSNEDENVVKELEKINYCRIPYVRNDLSLFTFFTLTQTNEEKNNKEKTTWRRTLKGKAIQDLLVYMPKTNTKRSVDIACRNAKTSENQGQTITVHTVQIEANDVDKNDEITLIIDQADEISGSCSFLYSPFTDDSISLKDSELYNLIGSESYFGYQIENGVLLWNVSKDTDYSVYEGKFTFTSKTFTNVNFTAITSDRPSKSEGEVRQALQNGAEIAIISFGVSIEDESDNTKQKCNYITEMTFATLKSVSDTNKDANERIKYEIEVTPTPYINRGDKTHFLPVGLLVSNVGPHVYIECSGAGVCNRNTGKCECYEGYYGSACQRLVCPNNCNNRGKCVTAADYFGEDKDTNYGDSILPVCKCDGGYRGIDCSQIECPSDVDPNGATNPGTDDEYRDCSGRGICDYSSGKCECFKGYGGSACESLLSTY